MFVRKLTFPNAICFEIDSLLCFVEEQFHGCLDIWRRSYELWILVINGVADMEKQLFNKESAAEIVLFAVKYGD